MEVTYIINSDFAMGGTGTTAYHAVSSIFRHNCLKKLIVRDYIKTEIAKEFIVRPVPFGNFFPKMLNGFGYYSGLPSQHYNNMIFDWLSLNHIGTCDIFHAWNHPIKCMQKAKQLGAIAVKEGASSHPLAQYNLLKSEFEKYKTKYRHSARALERSLKEIQMCDYIFVPSDFAYQTYIDNKVAEEKLVKIPFGVDLEMFSPKKRKTGDRFRAVFVGQIGLRKGVQYLLEAWRTLGLKNAELVLRGRIMPDARKLIRHYRSKINLVTPGHGDPGQDYLKSDIFVFPSIEEGSALASYEAMASGMPVIVTQNTGSIARNGRDGFVIPIRDIKILASKIRYLYDNPDERRRMGKNARKQAEKYPWDNYGNKIVQTYQRILNERKK